MKSVVRWYRKSVNPPYAFNDLPAVLVTFLFLIGLPVFVLSAQEPQNVRQLAAVTTSPNVMFVNASNTPITQTTSASVRVSLTSPWPTTLSQATVGGSDETNVLADASAIFQVRSSSDDVNQDGTSFDPGSSTVFLGNGRSTSYTGLRFQNVTIPRGSSIKSAWLQVHSSQSQWIRIRMNIAGENTGNSQTFSSGSRPSQRSLTTQRVNHNSNTRWNANTWYNISDVRTVLQAITNRSDWQSGNSVSLILQGAGGSWGRKFANSFDKGSAAAPRLVVSYSTGTDIQPTATPTRTVATSTPTRTPTPTVSAPTATRTPTPTTTPTTTPITESITLAEDPAFTVNVQNLSYTSIPTLTTYVFQNTNPGVKTLYAKFRSTTGVEQIFFSSINLVSIATPTPTPTTPPVGGHPGSGSNSHAMSQWSPNLKYDTCTKEQHDSYKVQGPDGKWYPTWHPPVDPATGCRFGHEHGRDPGQSELMPFIKEQYGGLLFGYANEKLDEFNTANNITNGMRHEDHVGHKIEWENNLQMEGCTNATGACTGPRVPLNIYCDFLLKAHQGTHSKDAFANNVHELSYFISCTDGTKLAATKMVAFGKPGQITDTCHKTRTINTGSAVPANSPSRNSVRFIGDLGCVQEFVWVPQGQWSQYSLGLYEDWVSDNYIRRTDGTVIAYFDPHFAVFGPSRYFDPTKPDNVGRSIDTCYAKEPNGDRARGGPCDLVTNYRDGSTVPLSERIVYDDPRSPFNGVKREFYFNQTWIRNPGGPTAWHTDPYGGRASTSPFPGSIRQYIAPIDQYNKTVFESQAIGADRNYGGNGVHAPN